ncbi:MAG TPA: four-helix bundle copper-binding protein, partial [Burkholderiales bacterium]|nr:four-helix bundle copper-binding protein [Burkholderiales bacterium]
PHLEHWAIDRGHERSHGWADAVGSSPPKVADGKRTARHSLAHCGAPYAEETDMPGTTMQQCIELCLDCYQACFTTAMRYCVPAGGKQVPAPHLGLMLNCAELCRTTAEFMMSDAPQHTTVCGACAAVCEACAQGCAEVGDMDECVDVCRRCAASCREMAGSGMAATGLTGSERQEDDTAIKTPM